MTDGESFRSRLQDDAVFTSVKLEGVDLSGSDAYDLVLRGCTFIDVNLGHVEWEGLRAERCTFHRCRFTRAHLDRALFEDCHFFDGEVSEGCDFYSAHLRHATFRRCNISMCLLEEASLYGLTLDECQATGTLFSGATFKNHATFHKNVLQYADLRGAKLAGCDLTHNDLKWARLDEADLSEALLLDCDLNGVTYRHTKFFGADLRGAEVLSLDIRQAEMRGIKIFEEQMLALLTAADVVVFPRQNA